MKAKDFAIVVSSITLVLLAVGVAGILPGRVYSSGAPAAVYTTTAADATVSSGITYQGRLTNADGARLTGSYTMRFVIYDATTTGNVLWDSGDLDVTVEDGLFTVLLGVNQAGFNGQGLWLDMSVAGQTLTPRQELLPTPYALGLRPGVDVRGNAIAPTDAVIAGYAEATGAAVYGDAMGGAALVGESNNSYGVWAASTNSWGGYFTSAEGYGIRVTSMGSDHYDYGAYITSNAGYGVYVQSANNQGVRAEAGDISGAQLPLGAVGVAGIGEARGMHGTSVDGLGVYGNSFDNYGIWGASTNYYGITGRTGRVDNNYGFYTPDNLYAASATFAGAVTQVMQNNGPTALSPGDVVVFSGVTHVATLDNAAMAQVSATAAANSTGVAGVVQSRFNIDAIVDTESPGDAADAAMREITPAGNAAPGEYVLVVVQGLAQVKVDQLAGDTLAPGDLLATSNTRGMATQASTLSNNGVPTTAPGTVFAKALEAADGTQEMIYVYVTLH